MNIAIWCWTNIDGYEKTRWPTCVGQPVCVGDYVEAESGVRLKVVSISHVQRDGLSNVYVELNH